MTRQTLPKGVSEGDEMRDCSETLNLKQMNDYGILIYF